MNGSKVDKAMNKNYSDIFFFFYSKNVTSNSKCKIHHKNVTSVLRVPSPLHRRSPPMEKIMLKHRWLKRKETLVVEASFQESFKNSCINIPVIGNPCLLVFLFSRFFCCHSCFGFTISIFMVQIILDKSIQKIFLTPRPSWIHCS